MSAVRSVTGGSRSCPRCGSAVDLADLDGELWWFCRDAGCSWRVILTAAEVAELEQFAREWDRMSREARKPQRWWLN